MSLCDVYIYKITNLVNNKIYIGKTKNIEKRWKRHIYLAKTGFKRHLYEAMRKYGIDNFSIEIIDECKDGEEDIREKYWIRKTQSYKNTIGYNKSFGGEGGNTWSLNNHKKETSEKISEKSKGHKLSEEARKRIAESKKGKPLPKETREKISFTLKHKYETGELVPKIIPNKPDRTGVQHTEKTKTKMSKAKKAKHMKKFIMKMQKK